MVIVDQEGVAAINWNSVLWKQKFELLNSQELILYAIEKGNVIVKYENILEESTLFLSFDIETGLQNSDLNTRN